MARSRRRSKRGSRSKGPRADWVYRPNVHDEAGGIMDDLGTYEPVFKLVTPGITGSIGSVLYDSHNYVKAASSVGNVAFPFPSVARSEGSRARIVWVQGVITASPTTWAVGSEFSLGMRFGIFEQDSQTGAFLIDPNYSMWLVSGNDAFAPAVWANDREWQREFRWDITFTDNGSRFDKRFSFPVRRSLPPNRCYGIFTETQTGSVNINVRYFLRTLVADEG